MIKTLLNKFISCYQYIISPFFGNCCRFHPSCSEYMKECIHNFGAIKGIYLGFKRLIRCHPWSQGGIDPAPKINQTDHKQP